MYCICVQERIRFLNIKYKNWALFSSLLCIKTVKWPGNDLNQPRGKLTDEKPHNMQWRVIWLPTPKTKTQTSHGNEWQVIESAEGTMWLSSCFISRQTQKSLSKWNVWVGSQFVFTSKVAFSQKRRREKKCNKTNRRKENKSLERENIHQHARSVSVKASLRNESWSSKIYWIN